MSWASFELGSSGPAAYSEAILTCRSCPAFMVLLAVGTQKSFAGGTAADTGRQICCVLQVIPIINIPGFGDRAAEKVCTDMKIQSQNDRNKLDEAKKQVYLKGFTDGVLTVGPHAGKKVSSQPARSGRTCIARR